MKASFLLLNEKPCKNVILTIRLSENVNSWRLPGFRGEIYIPNPPMKEEGMDGVSTDVSGEGDTTRYLVGGGCKKVTTARTPGNCNRQRKKEIAMKKKNRKSEKSNSRLQQLSRSLRCRDVPNFP